jgi:glycosyltransferase involved in cell wall biosynthesis
MGDEFRHQRPRAQLRKWLRPPMWTFEQHAPRPLDPGVLPGPVTLPRQVPAIAIVTPSYNHGKFLRATIDSVVDQNYPDLFYHIQDGGSNDDTVDILKSYGAGINWRSSPDKGQSDAINTGFRGTGSDIMAYLNSDDILLPGALASIANFFAERPDVDIIYGHRIFIDRAGSEIGRALLPAHNIKALYYADYVPQETMFWRRRVWDKIGPMDIGFDYAMDWDFILRAQAAGFKLERLRKFHACFRVHDEQKTTKNYALGHEEIQKLRLRSLGYAPTQREIFRAMVPYMLRQLAFHWSYQFGVLKQ